MHKLSLVHTDLKPENILLECSNFTYDHNQVPTQFHMVSSTTGGSSSGGGSGTSNLSYHHYQPFVTHHHTTNIVTTTTPSSSTITTTNISQSPLTLSLSSSSSSSSSATAASSVDNYCNLDNSDIVVIDFGGATFENTHHTTIVCSRPYRPPEIILGMGWSYPCDLWGVGCILIELYIGNTLFDTHSNLQHLNMMEKVIGPIPRDMSTPSSKYFNDHGTLIALIDESKELLRLKKLNEYFHPDHSIFLDLIFKLLEYQPSKRLSAIDALNHPFFKEDIKNDKKNII